MCLLGKESMLKKFLITTNEILDVSVSFLNDHLEETLGPTEIEKKTTQSVSISHKQVFYPNSEP